MTDVANPAGPLAARVAGQGVLLFSGLAAGQALSFLRNALIGYGLSKGDFGIAAGITLTLQMVEMLTDLGADRLIVQADDGAEPRVIGTSHTFLILRALLTGIALYLAAGPVAHFLSAPDAAWAFQAIAIVPVIKGFLHLDYRLFQRRLDNRPQLVVEVLPQAAALAATPVALALTGSYAAVIWLSILQAVAAVLASHALARTPYHLATDGSVGRRILAFGWPILASALPLLAVYHADRALIAHLFGIEALAVYSAAFLATMVPGLIAAKTGHALMLPLLAQARGDGRAFAQRFKLLSEATALFAGLYLATFIVAGGLLVRVAFGPNYEGLGAITGWLASMWAVRMLQAVPGMALMAHGDTRPFLIAGLIRACALLPAAGAALHGYGIAGVAAAGSLGEIASLVYVAVRLEKLDGGLGVGILMRALMLVPVALAAIAVSVTIAGQDLLATLAATSTVLMAVAIGCFAAAPGLRAQIRARVWRSLIARPAA